MDKEIDLVVPYVDSSDPEWQKLFEHFNPIKDKEVEGINAKNRFRGQGEFFKYFFRCIEKNLPWIRKVFLLVQSETQIPSWINKETVNIVYHHDFIPSSFLPTFNSTTIEMFLWNIPGLSEKFIYTNDDFFALKPLYPTDYFVDNKIRQMSILARNLTTMYGSHLLNNFCIAYDKNAAERAQILKIGSCPAFGHTFFPYIKSVMQQAYSKYKVEIEGRISMFRTDKNINHMFYSHYLIKNHYQEPLDRIISKGCINTTTTSSTIETILNHFDIVAIQDTASSSDVYQGFTLNSWFSKNYSRKSKYEK